MGERDGCECMVLGHACEEGECMMQLCLCLRAAEAEAVAVAVAVAVVVAVVVVAVAVVHGTYPDGRKARQHAIGA